MGNGETIKDKDVRELVLSVERLIESTQEVPKEIQVLETRLENNILALRKDVFKALQTHQKILFGDGQNSIGLIGRQNRTEDRLGLFWWAIGIFGTASIYGLVKMIIDVVSKIKGM